MQRFGRHPRGVGQGRDLGRHPGQAQPQEPRAARCREVQLAQPRRLIEHLFNKLKNWRRVATRYDKTGQSYLGFAAIKLWLPVATRFVQQRIRERRL
ncbi:hypothetical protein EN766_38470 [Mesorhizobium sp. M2A.F.Ca.ET.046.02.1.1]|nr:hypothetical protein EN766_38470 [Mesorhizobium sp. M2A.F.Ca.ET.046.02.1.1]